MNSGKSVVVSPATPCRATTLVQIDPDKGAVVSIAHLLRLLNSVKCGMAVSFRVHGQCASTAFRVRRFFRPSAWRSEPHEHFVKLKISIASESRLRLCSWSIVH